MIQAFLGLFIFCSIAWLFSEDRKRFPFKLAFVGIALQILIAFIFFQFPGFKSFFLILNSCVSALEKATTAGTSFVFGYLGGGSLPFDEKFPGASFILVFRSFPLILVISALSSLLFYWKILPVVVKFFSWIFQKILGISGAEGLGVSSNIFLGMVESPLLIKPYLKDMTRSELFSVMTCGMATIAGTVMVLYAAFLKNILPDAMGHILVASVISIPASIIVSKIMIPERESPTAGNITPCFRATSAFDAISQGTIQGVQLLINIVAMLIVLVALVHLFNLILGVFPGMDEKPMTLQRLTGFLFAPVTWLMGIPWNEAQVAGGLMGTKTVLNELLAYLDMSRLPEGALGSRSLLIMTYSMCGFANPGSLGIMIGGMSTLVPERRDEIVAMGFRTIVSGTLTTCMTGAVVGIIPVMN
ncbi:MAG: nucleoside:proton symporter [Candidatus Aureabacteria bacterium]|nr:nucleoside:proton symporter [Candidatus Auribacterota bacterium]